MKIQKIQTKKILVNKTETYPKMKRKFLLKRNNK